jgi:hypothetical protein
MVSPDADASKRGGIGLVWKQFPLLTAARKEFATAVEAPPSTSSHFGETGTDSATMDTVTGRKETDDHPGALQSMRQHARRGHAREGARLRRRSFAPGRRWAFR